jgi:hypothetical protein
MRPSAVVLGFIADDVPRGERRVKWEMGAAYFEMVNGSLELRNVPVPPPKRIASTTPLWQRGIGYSILINEIRARTGWLADWTNTDIWALPVGGAEPTICPMMKRLANVGVPTLLVALYELQVVSADNAYVTEQRRLTQKVLQCARDAGLATLDTFDMLSGYVRSGGSDSVYRRQHFNPNGNRAVADAIAAELERRHMLVERQAN